MSPLIFFLLVVYISNASAHPPATSQYSQRHQPLHPVEGSSDSQQPQATRVERNAVKLNEDKREGGNGHIIVNIVRLNDGEGDSTTSANDEYKISRPKDSTSTTIRLYHAKHHSHSDTAIENDLGRSLKSSNIEIDPPVEPRATNASTALIIGFRLETGEKGVQYEHNGVSSILTDTTVPVRLFGQHFTNQTVVAFVKDVRSRGAECDVMDIDDEYPVSHIGPDGVSALIEVTLSGTQTEEFYFLCVKENNTGMPWVHQGSDPWITVRVFERVLPVWLQIVFIILLLLLSGLFAGLTLGLMALDRTDLQILANTGSEKERMYAKAILPLRTQGNYLLCSLVLGNVLINSSLTILLDWLTSGILAITFSTIGIVVFGEIIPQALCSRHGLAIGAKTIVITRMIMILTFPVSYLISVVLDKLLGEEIGIVYNREKLKELIKITIEHNDLEADEVNIISGALELKKKSVEDIMTRLEDIFMLPLQGQLDFETLNEIRKQGYSRIPIYEGERRNIVTILFTKDLVFVDPDDRIPLKTLTKFYNNCCFYVFADTTLDVVFKEFKESQRGHMALVQKISAISDRDPFCEITGLVTLEDVIEELIQAEIVDETDMWMDNRSKKRAKHNNTKDFSKFVEIRNSQKTLYISPQLALAAFQYLSTGVEPFKANYISEGVLHKILKKHVLFKIRGTKDLKPCLLYEIGKPTDMFTIVLEGRVEVTVGIEGLQYEAGPFSYFAVPALMLSEEGNFAPDYSVRATGDVIILRIRRTLYQAAVQATILERAKNKDSGGCDAVIEKQIEDVLGSLEENEMSQEKIVAELESSNEDFESEKEHSQSTTSTEA